MHLLGTHQKDEGFVLLKSIDSDLDLPVAVGADRRYCVWMIKAAIKESMDMVHFEVRALLFMEGSRSETSTTPLPGLVQPTVLVVASLRFAATHRISLGGTFISSWIFVKT